MTHAVTVFMFETRILSLFEYCCTHLFCFSDSLTRWHVRYLKKWELTTFLSSWNNKKDLKRIVKQMKRTNNFEVQTNYQQTTAYTAQLWLLIFLKQWLNNFFSLNNVVQKTFQLVFQAKSIKTFKLSNY